MRGLHQQGLRSQILRRSSFITSSLQESHYIRPQPRPFHTSQYLRQQRSDPQAHRNFYRTHGRALFKALTLAFFTYQVACWGWLLLETEDLKDQKNREIKSLEGEVKLLVEGREMHRPSDRSDWRQDRDGKRLLEEKS